MFEGEVNLLRAGEALRLPADSYALIPTATLHVFRNRENTPARWFEMLSLQPKPRSSLKDTFFTGGDTWLAHIQDIAGTPAPSGEGHSKRRIRCRA